MRYIIRVNTLFGTFYHSNGSFDNMLSVITGAQTFDTIEAAASKIAELKLKDAVICYENGTEISPL